MLYREPGSYNLGLTGFPKAKYSPLDFRGTLTILLTVAPGYAHIGGNQGPPLGEVMIVTQEDLRDGSMRLRFLIIRWFANFLAYIL